jgi:hypothetical protein
VITKGCHTCKWGVGKYYEKPGGSSCNWIGEMFRGETNDWISWEPKIGLSLQAKSKEKQPKLSDLLRQVADQLDKEMP